MNVIAALMENPPLLTGLIGFGVGFAGGLFLALRTWLSGRSKRHELEQELSQLKSHLHRQMEITGEGNRSMRKELQELREQNENLRVTVKTLENKPGRAELRQLHVYEQAVRVMNKQAPGFAAAWESALEEAEQKVGEAETGIRALVRRVFRPVLPSGNGEGEQTDAGQDQEG